MLNPSSAICDSLVRGLAPTAHRPDETPSTIVCESRRVPGAERTRGTMTLRPKAGTTPIKTRTAASAQQARVKALCQQDASGDDVA